MMTLTGPYIIPPLSNPNNNYRFKMSKPEKQIPVLTYNYDSQPVTVIALCSSKFVLRDMTKQGRWVAYNGVSKTVSSQ